MAKAFSMNTASFETSSNPTNQQDETINSNLNLSEESDEESDDSTLSEKLNRVLNEANMILYDQTLRVRLDIRGAIEDIQNTIYPFINYRFLKNDGNLPDIQSEFQRVFNIEDLGRVCVSKPDASSEVFVETHGSPMDPSKCETVLDWIDWINCTSASGNFIPRLSQNSTPALMAKFEDYCKKTKKLMNDLVVKGSFLISSMDKMAKYMKFISEYFELYLAMITEMNPNTLQDQVNLNHQYKSMKEYICDFHEKLNGLEELKMAAEEYSQTDNEIEQEFRQMLHFQIQVSF